MRWEFRWTASELGFIDSVNLKTNLQKFMSGHLMNAKETVLNYWEAMRSNDFYAASKLSEDFECFWPQSSEIVRGRDNFVALNSAYPANGDWEFVLNSIVCEEAAIVTDHTVNNGLIRKQVEFWPDNYAAPDWRARWVERQA